MKLRLEELLIAVDLRLAPGLPTAWLDYKQIAYCLRTIINYVAAEQPAVDRIEVTTCQRGDRIMLCVNYRGVALSAEIKQALLTPFMKDETLGQGVGLPLCKIILERHGSSFEIEDRPDGTTQFCIILQQQKEDQNNEPNTDCG
jgi:nitrogen fixation/metabolism regulation signal transduction histidine kinase